ncbi:alpha/beta hydrolase [Congregibacter sp.]|uniref:alpha/beta hydrolase n=1 Tax=Congregibacter sp. TaxID=2744308 RepID=UPI00385FCC27
MRYISISKLLIALIAFALLPSANAEESVSLSNGEYAVPGVFSRPVSAERPSPALLLLHGTASEKNEVGDLYLKLAKRLAKAGIASLRIDFAGSGESKVDHQRYSLSGATKDAQTAFDFLSEHPLVDGDQIVVLGFSQGGLVAQRLVLQEPKALALATWSTAAANGRGSFARFFDAHYAVAMKTGYATVAFPWIPEPLRFSAQWFKEIDEQQTLNDMQDFSGPILSIAGTGDTTVPFQQSVDLVQTSSHPMSQVVLLAAADHIFNVLAPSDPSLDGIASSERLLSVTSSWALDIFQHYPGPRAP